LAEALVKWRYLWCWRNFFMGVSKDIGDDKKYRNKGILE